MGSESPGLFPADGEGPVRQVTLDAFYISKYPVTNECFEEFVDATGYLTEAQRFGWSFVFQNDPRGMQGERAPEAPWFQRMRGARWSRPGGRGTNVNSRNDHPAVHVSWNDAIAYCGWAGYRLPTEAEWEFAARGGLEQKEYPWGDELTPGGQHRCNIWQGQFPDIDLGEDGYTGTAPVHAFESNGFGLFTMVGNTWEWCADFFDAKWHVEATRMNPTGPSTGVSRILKGGSFLCHESYCRRYRNAARIGNTPNTSTGHIGFRVARDL
jgi:formylglycine-generating enzyme required for sulfatase activity